MNDTELIENISASSCVIGIYIKKVIITIGFSSAIPRQKLANKEIY